MDRNIKNSELLKYGIVALRRAKEENLTLIEFIIIGVISKLGKPSIKEINEEIELERTTISKSIKSLVSKNRVIVTQSSEDKRIKIVELKK